MIMNEQTIKIRPATRDDIPAMTDLLQLLFAIEQDFTADPTCQTDGLRLLLQDERNFALVAADGEKIIGMCTALRLISTAAGGYKALVEDVIVRPEYRQQGIGIELLQTLTAWAKKQGIKRLDLVAVHYNTAAISLYKKLGWQSTELIMMQKPLT
jgi:ribosomal protein S18 acetylase RimI-like enzyme